ncbi:MAG: hypothetical protein P8Z49_06055 [Acidobacteriota bacterium]
MIDVLTGRPIRLEGLAEEVPYFVVALEQKDEIARLFREEGVDFEVKEAPVSFDGRPPEAVFRLTGSQAPKTVQAVLDSRP